jgi:GrpB-like predicted nucleotidyltransferase (UPF0157 family)
MKGVSNFLESIGYEFRENFSTEDRFYLKGYFITIDGAYQTYHIHLTHPSSKEWRELIGFRDVLRERRDLRDTYEEVKKMAAHTSGQDGEIYMRLKEPIIQKIKTLIQN